MRADFRTITPYGTAEPADRFPSLSRPGKLPPGAGFTRDETSGSADAYMLPIQWRSHSILLMVNTVITCYYFFTLRSHVQANPIV